MISSEFDGSVGSTGFFVFRVPDGSSEFLLALVKSPIVQMQLQKYTTGSILASVPRTTIKKILIPNFPPDKQNIIGNVVKDAHQMFSKSRNLMNNAIIRVETKIEKSLS